MKKNIIITIVPTIHSGYISLFKKYSGSLYVLGLDFVKDFPHIERDLRTPDTEDLKSMISALGIFDEINFLDRETISKINLENAQIIMPDDDINKDIAKKYLVGKDIIFESVFLRWDKQITLMENKIPQGRIISESEADKELMSQAFEESKKSSDWWRQIGAFIVKDGKVILAGHNKHLPSDFNLDTYGDPRSNFDGGVNIELSTAIHGEASLVALAAKKGISLEGTSLYLTVFPCPVCAKLVSEAGVKKVYYSKGYSLLDAEDIFKAKGIEVILVK